MISKPVRLNGCKMFWDGEGNAQPEGAAGGGSPLLPSSRGDCGTRHGLGESSSKDALNSWIPGWKFVSADPLTLLSSTFDFHAVLSLQGVSSSPLTTGAVIFLPASRLRLSLLASRMHHAGRSSSNLRL